MSIITNLRGIPTNEYVEDQPISNSRLVDESATKPLINRTIKKDANVPQKGVTIPLMKRTTLANKKLGNRP